MLNSKRKCREGRIGSWGKTGGGAEQRSTKSGFPVVHAYPDRRRAGARAKGGLGVGGEALMHVLRGGGGGR